MTEYVLVTGGAGYVGSHACKALAGAGFVPVTVDNLGRGHARAVRWGPLVIGELADTRLLASVLAQYRPVGVLHFAALAYVGESVQAPDLYYTNNVGGSLSLFNALLADAAPPVVFSSSCAVYGMPLAPLLAEDHPTTPINPYGRSKLMVETLLRDYDAAVLQCGRRGPGRRDRRAARAGDACAAAGDRGGAWPATPLRGPRDRLSDH
jgi:UDP-arabinose 4-epimerase